MKKVLLMACILISFAVIILGCKAEKGDSGPTGPQGNANVKSKTVAVTSSNWVYSTSPNEFAVNITDGDITQDIVDHGMVLVYMSNGSGAWIPLPIIGYTTGTSGGNTYDLEYKLSPVYGLSGVTIWYYVVTDPFVWIPANPGSQTFKIITVASLAKASVAQVDLNNYEKVKNALHLED
ncbi:MAG: hypothetical protein ABSF91_13860 [Bacteroidota bacterium]|jgi:hypothetical protein